MIALQLYTVRERTAQDFLGTLRQLADMGYRNVEFAGYGGTPVPELRAALDEYGLRAISAHVPIQLLRENRQQALQDLQTLGCEHAVVPGIWGEERSSAEQVRRLAGEFNEIGRACREAGLQFGYHNHSYEFEPLDGTTMYDIVARDTDPGLVNLQIDIFWVKNAGPDPVQLMRQHAGRIPLVHVKDMAEGPDREDAPVGEGVLPYDQYLQAAREAGAQVYIVEQDNPKNAMEDVRTSLRNLETLVG
jgi:sugar phosphate isomerase/epimerase